MVHKRNGYKYDSTSHIWILLMKICRTTKTLVAFKCQLFSHCAIVTYNLPFDHTFMKFIAQ